MNKILILIATILIGLIASVAIAATPLVLPPQTPVELSRDILIEVFWQVEQGEHTETLQIPQQLPATVRDGVSTIDVVLSIQEARSIDTPVELTSEMILQTHYVLSLPDGVKSGVVELRLQDYALPASHLVVMDARKNPVVTLADMTRPQRRLETVTDAEEVAIRNDFLANIGAYKPIYFIGGGNPANAKFQISFDYQLFAEGGSLAEHNPWVTGFHLGYTQTSFWDLASDSLPFEDTNFKPELFYRLSRAEWPTAAPTDIQFGIKHLSNGRDGDASRSFNVLYVEPAWNFLLSNDYYFSLSPRAWVYFGSRAGNEDIADFRGNASLTATVGRRDGFQLETLFRGNPSTGQGAIQLDFTYPLNELFSSNLDIYLYGQFFDGFGESLLDFDERDTRLRFGFGIVR